MIMFEGNSVMVVTRATRSASADSATLGSDTVFCPWAGVKMRRAASTASATGAALLVAAMALVGCSGGNTDSAEGGNLPTNVLTPKGWELVWSDEFDGSSLDGAEWNTHTGDGTAEGIPGWGNNELQSYQADNVSVSGGNLIITARSEAADGRDYTSGRINTAGKLDMRYGRVEASIHAPGGQGMWSALWMLPTDSVYGTWAARRRDRHHGSVLAGPESLQPSRTALRHGVAAKCLELRQVFRR